MHAPAPQKQSIRQRPQVRAGRIANPRAGRVRNLAGPAIGAAAGGPESVSGVDLVEKQQEAVGAGQGF